MPTRGRSILTFGPKASLNRSAIKFDHVVGRQGLALLDALVVSSSKRASVGIWKK